jgi:hypothetical protein
MQRLIFAEIFRVIADRRAVVGERRASAQETAGQGQHGKK